MSFRFWFLLSNDVKRPIGGVKQAHRLCECLVSLGFEATIIQEKIIWGVVVSFDAKTISYSDFLKLRGLRKDVDIIFLAETMITSVQLFAWFKKIIFNQNASYPLDCLQAKTDSLMISHCLSTLYSSRYYVYGACLIMIMTRLLLVFNCLMFNLSYCECQDRSILTFVSKSNASLLHATKK